jgi:hypothetical protein
MSPSENRFEALFAQHRSAAIPDLWPWQREILTPMGLDADAAVAAYRNGQDVDRPARGRGHPGAAGRPGGLPVAEQLPDRVVTELLADARVHQDLGSVHVATHLL